MISKRAPNEIAAALESISKKGQTFIVFPTIVFDGEIFEFNQDGGDISILPINHIQFMSFQKAGKGMFPCLIDVVRKTDFFEFLQLIDRDFQIFTELVKPKGI